MAKIMLVEDDKSLREIYSIRLDAENYDIVAAGDGEEALGLAVQEKPDLIISDVMMPKISGFDMLDILRSTPETKDIKVIMMTALSSDDQRRRSEALGAEKHLVKSQCGIEDVINAVHEVLGDRPGDNTAGQVPAHNTTPMDNTPATPNDTLNAGMANAATDFNYQPSAADIADASEQLAASAEPAPAPYEAPLNNFAPDNGMAAPLASDSQSAVETMPQSANYDNYPEPSLSTNDTTGFTNEATANNDFIQNPSMLSQLDPSTGPAMTQSPLENSGATAMNNANFTAPSPEPQLNAPQMPDNFNTGMNPSQNEQQNNF